MGARGPAPKREDQRRRRNATEGGPPTKGVSGFAPGEEPPAPLSTWHPIARRFWERLAASGQADFFEPSDWAVAEIFCEAMSRELRPQRVIVDGKELRISRPPSAATLAAWMAAAGKLLATEADRRRLRLELDRVDPNEGEPSEGEGAGSVAWIDDARARLHGAG